MGGWLKIILTFLCFECKSGSTVPAALIIYHSSLFIPTPILIFFIFVVGISICVANYFKVLFCYVQVMIIEHSLGVSFYIACLFSWEYFILIEISEACTEKKVELFSLICQKKIGNGFGQF